MKEELKDVDVSAVVTEMRNEQDGIKDEAKSEQLKANISSIFKMNKDKANAIVADADNTPIAKLLNHLIFGCIKCKNGKLTEEDVQKINPGGGVVASLMVVMPNLPLNHPFIILGVRLFGLYLKVRVICNSVSDGIQEVKDRISDKLGGIKPEFAKTVVHE